MDAETTLPTCYRHDDRETRLSCSRCERPVCVDCVRTASVGQLCLECARPDPGTRVITARQIRSAGLRESSPVTFWLIVACAVTFVLSQVSPAVATYGPQVNVLVAQGEWWRILTAAFLHGSLLHIFFNMYALYLFGPGLERQVGGGAFLSLYLGSAMAGGAAYFLYFALGAGAAGAAVGASGAIFGLFGATLALAWRNRRSTIGQAGLRQLMTLLAINLALPLLIPRIAWQAHLGGLVAGLLIALWWVRVGRSGGTALRSLAGAAIAIASLALVLLV